MKKRAFECWTLRYSCVCVNKGNWFRRKNLESEGGHTWREYTYRKITPCDACGQVLRGHSRQGVRCRNCKANAHTDCISTVAVCPSLAPKKSGGIPLLRRQKTQVADEVPASSEHSEYKSDTRDPATFLFSYPLFAPSPFAHQRRDSSLIVEDIGERTRPKRTGRFLDNFVISCRLIRGYFFRFTSGFHSCI